MPYFSFGDCKWMLMESRLLVKSLDKSSRHCKLSGKRLLHFLIWYSVVGTTAIGGRRLTIHKVKLVEKRRVHSQSRHREEVRQSTKQDEAYG